MEELTGGQRPKDEPDVKVLRTLLFAEGGKGKTTRHSPSHRRSP